MDVRTAPAENRPHRSLPGTLANLSVDSATRALAAASDVTLLIDADGIVTALALGSIDLANHGLESWLGQHWADTVLPENRVKIAEMLQGTGTPGRWRQVNHPSASGDIPIRYLALPADGDGRMVAVGRDMRAAAAMQQRLLRAQQTMERDSLRLRQLEARYRLLFDSAAEAIIVVDATNRRIAEANPAARRLAAQKGGGGSPLEGQAFANLVDDGDRDTAVALLASVAAAEQRHPGRVRLASGESCLMSATMFRQDRGSYLLVRLQPLDRPVETLAERPLTEVLERMPDAFVLTDANFDILTGNGLFLDMVQQARRDDLRGQPMARFIGRPGIDLGVLASQLREHGSVRNFATIIRAADGHEEDVEVSAVISDDAGDIRHGFSIRRATRMMIDPIDNRQLPRSVEQLTELVGRVSLKEIVRESTDLIERLCIEAALTYTSDNRASAAEILGLSRQSLYSKLHRHGLGNLSDND